MMHMHVQHSYCLLLCFPLGRFHKSRSRKQWLNELIICWLLFTGTIVLKSQTRGFASTKLQFWRPTKNLPWNLLKIMEALIIHYTLWVEKPLIYSIRKERVSVNSLSPFRSWSISEEMTVAQASSSWFQSLIVSTIGSLITHTPFSLWTVWVKYALCLFPLPIFKSHQQRTCACSFVNSQHQVLINKGALKELYVPIYIFSVPQHPTQLKAKLRGDTKFSDSKGNLLGVSTRQSMWITRTHNSCL